MNTFYYIVDSIDGDYAHLQRVDENGNAIENEELKLVARALLPDTIAEGTHLIYEWMQYKVLGE